MHNYYSCVEEHTIRKVKFLSKYSILTKPQNLHEFFTKIFLTIFLVKSKLNFWTKNEDFEQCEEVQNFKIVKPENVVIEDEMLK